MKPENAIEVKNLKKSFKVYLDKGSQLKEKVLFQKRRRFENREVLKGISFDVKKGEAIGLIGHNGCGKSTTLKLLTRIIYPDSGTVEMKGRVSSLIELGAGFHPDMSGRENIYTNAAIFGLTREEIDARVEDIIEFSELEDFIDNPVRTYSSGMYMRLAFAVAINVDADILLIDEILAVGDASFQAKCFDKMKEIKAEGTTIVIVSHAMEQIVQFCDRSIWIHHGEIKEEGDASEVGYAYLDYMGKAAKARQKRIQEKKRKDEKKAEESRKKDEAVVLETYSEEKEFVRQIEILDAHLEVDGQRESNIRTGSNVQLKVLYKRNEIINDAVMGVKIYTTDNVTAYGFNSQFDREQLDLEKEQEWITVDFPQWNLGVGRYYVDIAFREENMTICDYKNKAIEFTVYYPIVESGIAHLPHTWSK